MPLNPYFSQGRRSEQTLYEDIVVEALKIYGQDVYYLPRTQVRYDTILNDEIPATFGSNHKLEMYIENIDGFDGDGDLFTKFGVEIRDVANFVISKRSWNQRIKPILSAEGTVQYYRPKEGDLLFLPLSGSLFKISKVEDERPFYQLKNLPVFRITAELFEYNDEDLDTGIDAIDAIEKNFAYQWLLTMDSDGTIGNYTIGETVTQTLTDGTVISGEVVKWSDSDDKLYLAHVGADDGQFHTFVTTRQVIGSTSGNVATPSLVAELQSIQNTAQNTAFDDYEVSFIDFSEGNPFGDMQ